jgi:hypothetical protein
MPEQGVEKDPQMSEMKMPSTPWIRKLAAFLQRLSLLGETRARAQDVEARPGSTAG